MIEHYGKCFNCEFKEFTGPGKIGLLEEIVTLIRDWIITKRENENARTKRN